MIDFTKYDGYEFEDLITKVLKAMGFLVEQTSLSGDGGIDIIIYDERPITKGKYIIQCKNWTNLVGEPPVRDLFGTVMSERANKGILITTSAFTKQAKKFADGKNLELLDYNGLMKIFNDNNIRVNEELKDIKRMFYEDDEFEKDKYWYIKSKIDEDKTVIFYYEKMQELLHYYIISNKYDINKNGLIDEYIELNNEVKKRFYNRKSKNNWHKDNINFINMYLNLIKGEIFKSIELCIELGGIEVNSLSEWENYENITGANIYEYGNTIYIKNLLIIFHHLKFVEGESYILSLCDEYILNEEKMIESMKNHPRMEEMIIYRSEKIKKAKQSVIEITENTDITIIYPSLSTGNKHEYYTQNTVNIKEFVKNYYFNEAEIIKELEKTKLLFT